MQIKRFAQTRLPGVPDAVYVESRKMFPRAIKPCTFDRRDKEQRIIELEAEKDFRSIWPEGWDHEEEK
jgi:hypothetical protein